MAEQQDGAYSLEARLTQWSDDLAAWAIPDEILEQADEPPWLHAVATFEVVGDVTDSPSHRLARMVLEQGGSVLDVGCGGGRASAALIPPAGTVIGVDHQQGMLDAFAAMAVDRGVRHHEYLGDWPDVADEVPECDVVVCHHVAFNVSRIEPFLRALDERARRRVVLELPMRHPLARMNPLWLEFWGLERPTGPSAVDLFEITKAMGFDAHMDVWADPQWGQRSELTPEAQADFVRRKLCLKAERTADVAAVLAVRPVVADPAIVTVWWDV